MTTAESDKAFAKLVEARNRLNEITRRLNELHPKENSTTEIVKADGSRYRQIQVEWDAAFLEFEAATKTFTAMVKQLRNDAEE